MRKQTRRKIWALVNPIEHATKGAATIPNHDLVTLRTRELAAIEAFRTGKAGIQEWHDVNSMLTLCETATREGIGAEAVETCEKAQDALKSAVMRYRKTGKMGTDGLGLQAFRDLYEYHDLQRTSISRSEYERLINTSISAIKSGAKHIESL